MRRADVVSAEGDDVFGWLVGWVGLNGCFLLEVGSDVFGRVMAHVAFRGT